MSDYDQILDELRAAIRQDPRSLRRIAEAAGLHTATLKRLSSGYRVDQASAARIAATLGLQLQCRYELVPA